FENCLYDFMDIVEELVVIKKGDESIWEAIARVKDHLIKLKSIFAKIRKDECYESGASTSTMNVLRCVGQLAKNPEILKVDDIMTETDPESSIVVVTSNDRDDSSAVSGN